MVCAIVLAMAFAFPVAAAATVERSVVATRSGPVRGVVDGQGMVFRGIPYAVPPVGDLRWRAPQPVSSWRTVLDADRFGPDCMQIPFKGDAAPLAGKLSEDCLYLNVWTPVADHGFPGKRPVMVWIHGGGFVNGGSSAPVFSGQAFAESGVVFVSFNYRLGRFGFFAHPSLTLDAEGAPTGNYGLLDQIAALSWVRENIAAFGGDPDNITIFGESAGGMSVHALVTTPLARNLFHKAIVMSGGGRELKGAPATAAEAEAIGVGFARESGIMGEGADALAALRALPADSVMSGLNLLSLFGTKDFTPLHVDGKIVRRTIDAAYACGDGAAVPMIIGANDADGFFFRGTLDQAYAPLADVRPEAERIYDPEDGKDAVRIGVAISADMSFLEPVRHIARIVEGRGQSVFAYRFGYVPEYLRAMVPGAFHATELPFFFGTVDVRHGDGVTASDRAAARLAHEYWINFAKSGIPSSREGGLWSPYRAATDAVMIFDAAGAHEEVDPIRPRLDFIEQFMAASMTCSAT